MGILESLGWGSKTRMPGEDPYKLPSWLAPGGGTYSGNRAGFDWGDLRPGELAKTFARNAGIDDAWRAGQAWKYGDARQLARSAGAGVTEALSFAAPVGRLGKLAVGGSMLGAFGPETGASAQRAANEQAAIRLAAAPGAAKGRATTPSQMSSWERARTQEGVTRAANTTQGQMGSWERAITGGGGGSQGEAIRQQLGVGQPSTPSQQQQVANRFSNALRGLTPAQEEYFTQMAMDAERRRAAGLGDIDEQEAEARRRAALSARNIAARGAGSLADLRAAAGQAGMLMSPASYEVGREFEAGQTAAGLASQRAALDQFLGQAERGRSDIAAGYKQFMDDVRRQRLAQQKENEMMWAQQLMDTLGQYGFPSGG